MITSVPGDASTEWVASMGFIFYVITVTFGLLAIAFCVEGITSIIERFKMRRAKG